MNEDKRNISLTQEYANAEPVPHKQESVKAIVRKKKELYELQAEVNAKIRRLEQLKHDIIELVHDECQRRNLPEDMEPKDLVAFLRKYRGLNRFCAYTGQRREPIRHGELYDQCCEIVERWTIKDVNEVVSLMQNVVRLTREKAIAKMFVDFAFEYKVLYEYFMNVPGYFEKFVDEQKRPVSVTKLNVLYTEGDR